MSKKQMIMIAGGTAFGAIAAVGLMSALKSDEPKSTEVPSANVLKKQTAGITKTTELTDEENIQGKARARVIVNGLSDEASGIDTDELARRGDEMRDGMRERQMETLNNKIAKWSAALGLDEDQKGKLLDIASTQFDELETLAKGAEGADPAVIADSAKRAMAIMSGRALEESMGGLLTDEQQTQYEAFGTRQTGVRAEARTLRQLATLQEDLMLTPEQRNSAYGIMYESNLKQVEGSSDVSSMIDQFTSQSGITLDPSMEGTISALASRGLAEMANGGKIDREAVQNMAAEAMNDSINQQIEQLRPVLTAPQLELYRSQLEGRLGNLGNMIPGANGGN